MILRALIVAVVAGLAAGFAVSALQAYKLTPLIHAAETYETGGSGSAHEQGAVATSDQHHDAAAWAPADGFERVAYTVLANLLTGIGFALVLVAGFVLSGRRVTARNGLLWGMAGFAAFVLAPALQLPPELPATAALDLTARQAAWLGIAVATAAGIALIVFGRRPGSKGLGVVLVIAPQLVALPPIEGTGAVPPELAAEFAVLSVAVGAFFWAVLGGFAGYLYGRAEA